MDKRYIALIIGIIGLVVLGSVNLKISLGVALFVAAHRIAEHR